MFCPKCGKKVKEGAVFLVLAILTFSGLFFWNKAWAQATEVNGKIAFVKTDEKGHNPNIWLMNADGSGAKQITTDNDSNDPCWLPDGRIAFTRHGKTPASMTINVAQPDGSQAQEVVLEYDAGISDLACSPTENRIAYVLESGESGSDIAIVEVGKKAVNITNNSRLRNCSPSFSPDGKRILFEKEYQTDKTRSLVGSIFSMALDGSDEKLLVHDPLERYSSPIVSPQGDRLAFERYGSETTSVGAGGMNHYLLLAKSDGSGDKSFWPDFGEAKKGYALWNPSLPDWSPDGQSLVFSVSANKVEPWNVANSSPWENSIWSVPISGGPAKKLVDGGIKPKWQKVGAITTAVISSPTPSSQKLLPGEKIAFTRDTIKPEPLAGATPELWLLTESGEKIITDDKNDNVRDFVISPDGKRLFYVLDHGWTTGGDVLPWEKDLFIYDIGKNEKKKLSIAKRPVNIAFSPDGEHISLQDEVVTKISKEEYDKRMDEGLAAGEMDEYYKVLRDFWIADKDGGNAKMIRPSEEEAVAGYRDIWSPDSSKIGFYGKLNRMDNCWNSLWVYDLNKGESKKVKDDEVRDFTFSPDSSKIALATRAGAEIIDLSGNKIVDLAAEKTKSADKIFWFTDKIIFQGDVGCNNTIQPQTLWQVKPDGGNLEKLYEANSPNQIFYFVPSANGEKILLMDSKKGAGLKILETKTKKIQDLGKGERPSDFWGSWGVGNSQTSDFLIFQNNPSLSLEEEATYNPWNLFKLNSETFTLEPLAKDLEGASVAWYVPKPEVKPSPTPAPSQSSLSKLKQYLSGFFQEIYDKTIGRIISLFPGEEKIKISPDEEDKILEGSVTPVDFMKNWQITNVTYFKGNIFRGERTDWYIMLETKNPKYALPVGKKAFVLFELYDKKDTAKGWLNTLGGPGEVIEKVDVGSSEKIPNQTVIKVPDVILFPAFWPDEMKVIAQFYVEGKGNVSLEFTRDINIEANPNVELDCTYGMTDAVIDLSAASGIPFGQGLKELKKEINYAKAINECNQGLPKKIETNDDYEAMGRHTACCLFEYAAKESPLKYFKAACTYAQRAIACKTVFTEYLPDYWSGVSTDLMAKGVPINVVVLGSAAEVVVNSETQKKIGIADGKVVNDFGDAGLVAEGHPTIIAFEGVIPFSINVKGLEEGTFDLSLIQAKPEGKVAKFDYNKVPISPDQTVVLTVKPTGDPQKDFPLTLADKSQKQPDKVELPKIAPKPTVQKKETKLSSYLILGVIALFVAAILVALVIIFKKKRVSTKTEEKQEARFCRNCGKEITKRVQFCPECGQKL